MRALLSVLVVVGVVVVVRAAARRADADLVAWRRSRDQRAELFI